MKIKFLSVLSFFAQYVFAQPLINQELISSLDTIY